MLAVSQIPRAKVAKVLQSDALCGDMAERKVGKVGPLYKVRFGRISRGLVFGGSQPNLQANLTMA